MSIPHLQTQRSLFEPDIQFARLFKSAPAERFRFFGERVMPQLHDLRPRLEAMYCLSNGRPAEEPTRMLAVLILQFMEGLPDRKAVEACNYDLRWKLALGMECDECAFHPTSLVKFRNRLLKHNLVEVGFDAVLGAMRKAGYLKAHKAQRLDSTHVLGLVSHMSRLECVRETLRLSLEILEELPREQRPETWPIWWERYVQSDLDFKANLDTLKEKMIQAGQDARGILDWIDVLGESVTQLKSVKVLRRVYEENFLVVDDHLEPARVQIAGSVRNPHDPDAQWSTKGTLPGKSKEWVGYKTQVAETVPTSAVGTQMPTDAVITAIVTQPAITSDHGSISQVEEEWKRQALEKPAELYVDGGYTSGEVLAKAAKENRQVHGPIQTAPQRGDRFSAEDFDVDIHQRATLCPAGQTSTNCSRLQEATGKVNYRFEWNRGLCQSCPHTARCLGANQSHRTLVVGEHHQHTQTRRHDMKTAEFKELMHRRNGVEATISELKRAHGMRRSRYRSLAKTALQNFLIGAACNIKRWSRRTAWESQNRVLGGLAESVRG